MFLFILNSFAPALFSSSTISGVDLTVPVFLSVGVVFLVLRWLRVL
jgi:hypothetical protein